MTALIKHGGLCLLALLGMLSLHAQGDRPAKKPRNGFMIDTVYFRFDSDQLQDEFKADLDSMVGIFTDYPAYYVEVYGHTDSIGSSAYNLKLSQKRAEVITLYLVSQGVALERIVYEGLSTNKPVASNDTYAGRTKNRRADIAVVFSSSSIKPEYAPDVPLVTPAPEPPAPVLIIDTVYCDYTPFSINTQHQTVVIAPQGTQLTIPPNAFDTEEQEVEITFGELYKRRDMIVAQMPTISRKGPLEAAGMFVFEAKAERRPVEPLENVTFDVQVPATRRDANMAVYSGRAERARRRRPRKGETVTRVPGDVPSMRTVSEWRAVEDAPEVRFNGRTKTYRLQVSKPGSYAVARPLYYATTTDKEDEGIDFRIKFKGKRFEDRTYAMMSGDVVKTYIPLRKESTRIYRARKVQFLSDETELVVIAYEFDDRGRAYWTKLTLKPDDFLNRKARKLPNKRPEIKLKLKFRKIDLEELNTKLLELNG